MWCADVCVDQRLYVALSVMLLIKVKSNKHAEQRSVKTLRSCISLRMVRSRTRLLHTHELTELLDEVALEVGPLVRMESGWDPVVNDELVLDDFSCSLGYQVLGGDRQRILGKMICDYKYVSNAFRGFKRQKIKAPALTGMWRGR